jgi:hypothetical protein
MVRRGVDDPRDAGPARGLEHVVDAVQVRAGDDLERRLVRDRAQVHDRVDAVDRALHRVEVGQVGAHERLVRGQVVHVLDVRETQLREALAQRRAQHRADGAGRAGDQHSLHRPTVSGKTLRGAPGHHDW